MAQLVGSNRDIDALLSQFDIIGSVPNVFVSGEFGRWLLRRAFTPDRAPPLHIRKGGGRLRRGGLRDIDPIAPWALSREQSQTLRRSGPHKVDPALHAALSQKLTLQDRRRGADPFLFSIDALRQARAHEHDLHGVRIRTLTIGFQAVVQAAGPGGPGYSRKTVEYLGFAADMLPRVGVDVPAEEFLPTPAMDRMVDSLSWQ